MKLSQAHLYILILAFSPIIITMAPIEAKAISALQNQSGLPLRDFNLARITYLESTDPDLRRKALKNLFELCSHLTRENAYSFSLFKQMSPLQSELIRNGLLEILFAENTPEEKWALAYIHSQALRKIFPQDLAISELLSQAQADTIGRLSDKNSAFLQKFLEDNRDLVSQALSKIEGQISAEIFKPTGEVERGLRALKEKLLGSESKNARP